MLSDPAASAWRIAGEPGLDASTGGGRCGRCGTDGPSVASTQVVSERFSGIDTWPYGWRRLCVTCAWAYSRSPVVAPIMLITTTAVTEYSTGPELAQVLAAGPLASTSAAIMPTTRRRHILPGAQWGHLAVDGLVVRWDGAAAQRLTDLLWLRRSVCASSERPWKDLGRAAPPHSVLAVQPAELWPQILLAWERLQPWRSLQPLWTAARLLTYQLDSSAGG